MGYRDLNCRVQALSVCLSTPISETLLNWSFLFFGDTPYCHRPVQQDRDRLVMRPVEMALWHPQGDGCVILHSDRGSQFRSGDYQRLLERNTLICSMSAVAHCGDNAACEGFFGMPKRERIHHMKYPTLDAAKADVFNHIERLLNPGMRRRVAKQDLKIQALLNRP